MSSQTQDARAEQTAEQRRRKRKERAAKSRTPEPKNIVSGAGQPLDPGMRRELEEQLGHDLGRVRLHTDRDAGQLTELLGADAVAVGQDIFFREGAFKPGTDEGRRLLTHELQHTVQNPHGLGTLRAGRDLGAVSLPQQAIEQEAEAAAQAVVQASEEAPQVEEGQATPGWLRYTTVDADRMRAEAIDPATLVDRLAGNVLRSLRGDPTDASGRVRLQLARMSERLEDAVVERLESRLLTPEYERLLDLADDTRPGPVELQPADVPLPEIDLFEELGVERVQWQKKKESDRGSSDKRAEDTREEQKDANERDQQAGSQRSRAQSDVAAEDQEAAQRKEQEDERAASRERAEQEQQQEEEQASADRERVDEAANRRTEGQQEGAEEAKEERKEQREREEADPQQASAPGADKRRRRDQQTQPAAGAKREELDPKAKGQPGRVRPEKVDERAEQRDSALSEHGLHEKDEHEDDVREEEKPLGLEAGADDEVKGGEADEKGPEAKPEPTIKPEDHLPEADLDLSAVPTADQLQPGAAEPSVPTFPTPPPTKAEKIEREREKGEQERDGDDAVADGPETKAPGQDEGPVEGEAPQPEGGPAALAEDRGAKDLQETEKPLDQEVGPDPATEDKERPEPEAEKPDPAQEQEQQQAKEPGAEEEPGSLDEDERQDATEEPKAARTAAEPAERTAEGARSAAAPAAPAVNAAPAPVRKPAGAATPRTAVEDRNPSPAARRGPPPPKPARGGTQAHEQGAP
ncbi:eCIS core domain-containing protein, partial [Streptomyces sp. NPDC002814]